MNFIKTQQGLIEEPTMTLHELSEADWFPFSYNKIRRLVISGALPSINLTKGTNRPTYIVREQVARDFVKSLYS